MQREHCNKHRDNNQVGKKEFSLGSFVGKENFLKHCFESERAMFRQRGAYSVYDYPPS